MRAVLHDGSVVQHEDLVGMFDGCQPVGYHDHGLSLGEFRKRRLDQGFVLGVYACRGLVQNDDGSVLEKGPGDGDALLLTAGKGVASLSTTVA